MKLQPIAGAILALCGAAASAQPASGSNVVLYGVMDTGVEYLTNVGPARGSMTRLPTNTGSVPSRIGFRGVEDLGGGLKAVFNLEGGLGIDAGVFNQAGRPFGREAVVGLAGPWGTVTLGRQPTMLFLSLADANIVGPNIYGIGALDLYLPNARADNSIAYRGTFAGFTLGATYSLGRDVANAGPSAGGTNCAGESATDAKQCREWSAMVKYDTASWGAAASIDRLNGGPGAFAGLVSGGLQDTRISLNGYANFGQLRVGGGLIRRDDEGSAATPKSDLWYIGAAYAATPALVVDGQLARIAFDNSANKATLGVVRGTYSLSKRSAVYAQVARISNRGASAYSVSTGAAGSNPAPGVSQTGLMVGIRHVF
ncbi:MAG: outer rane porin protein [Ramlibacter sp.]|nr:outer rane porin protein [Ramlibacter sp.]